VDAAGDHCGGGESEDGKMFFSEEKNQKTFMFSATSS
jgi:hypothetical protein